MSAEGRISNFFVVKNDLYSGADSSLRLGFKIKDLISLLKTLRHFAKECPQNRVEQCGLAYTILCVNKRHILFTGRSDVELLVSVELPEIGKSDLPQDHRSSFSATIL